MPYDIAQRSCTQSDGTEGSYVLRKRDSGEQVSCHVSRAAAESARRIRLQAEKQSGAPSTKATEEEISGRYDEFQSAVNMNASEIEQWGKNDCADQASENPQEVRNRVIRLLRTPKADWGDSEYEAAGRVISFVSRMRGVQGGDAPSEDCPSKRTISLRNWGFDPSKSVSVQVGTEPDESLSSDPSKQTPSIGNPSMEDPLINFGGGLKVLGSGKQYGKDPSGPRVGGYAIVYTGPNDLDLDGQFFSKDTDFWLPQGSKGFVWPIYGHGQDPTLKNKRFSSKPWKVREDDAGLWMEGQLEIADKYDEMVLEKGIKPGKMGLSTGALSHLVSVSKVAEGPEGAEHIDDWPVYENSITPQPSEFRTKLGLEIKEHGVRRLGNLPMPGAKAVCADHTSKTSTRGYRAENGSRNNGSRNNGSRSKDQHSYSEGDLVAWEGGDAQGRVVTVSTSGTARGSMEPEGTTHETSEENPGYVIQLVDREDGEIVGRTDSDGNPQTVFHRGGSLMSITEEDVAQKEDAGEPLPEGSPLKELAGFAESMTEQIEETEASGKLDDLASGLSALAKTFEKGTTLAQNLDQEITSMVEGSEDMSRADVIGEMASEAGIDESTVRSILGDSPEIDCPPRSRLEGFARAFGIDTETVVGWARSDGCSYDG